MWLATVVAIELAAALGAYTKCYSEELGLDKQWEIELSFDSLPHEWVAATRALPDYYLAEIRYDTTAIREVLDGFPPDVDRDSVLRRLVLHELWHIMMWELSELAEAANPYAARVEEQLATRIERMPFWQGLCRE